ncbi:rRNA-processing protein UTP23 homolog [Zingiber officinale]|uniref:rRNA-processing protein UTP23 homolog n=1 Tax=Zingiber officinale TaxID=94328 RepID=UPI001C4CD35E|nr:rRNA-processing protein UTP23 homolog [Zingiber officinale]
MRVKKQKRHRKVVRFYSACFGFREPYKVLCDGTFIHHLLLHRLTPINDALARLLGTRIIPFTTRCIIGELRSLGESHCEALEAAQKLMIARCDHEKRINAMDCIESVVGEANSEHFFVATQDADMRKKFQKIPGVPVMYGLRNSLFIEQPSSMQKQFVKSSEERRLHLPESEDLKLRDMNPRDTISNNPDHGDADETLLRTASDKRNLLGVSRTSQLKRKRAKGPNPLSCKKKKQSNDASIAKKQNGGNSVGATKKKRIRKRKRTKEPKNVDAS